MAKTTLKTPGYETRSEAFRKKADKIVASLTLPAIKIIEGLMQSAEDDSTKLSAAKYLCKLSGLEANQDDGDSPVAFVPVKISRLYREADDE